MNILFVLYHDFTANSAAHVHSLANALTNLGDADCAVCVPENRASVESIGGEPLYAPLLFEDVTSGRFRFRDGRGADIVHAWTPREVNRKLVERQSGVIEKAKVLVHLEDNEEHLTARSLGAAWRDLQGMPLADLDAHVPVNLSHPIRYRQFMEQADGATVIVDRLRELVPAGKPCEEVWCSADEALFLETPVNYDMRDRMAIPADHTVIVYPGNVHAANAAEVRSLYTAVAILNREGLPVTLIRAGRDFCEFLDHGGAWAEPYVIELGLVPHKNMPRILAMADLFVQPGRPGEFNDYRFPSKLPEFLAIGRPVILPASNIGLQMKHLEDAYIVPRANAVEIADGVKRITGDPELRSRLARGARRFFDERLSWKQGALKLRTFYQSLQ